MIIFIVFACLGEDCSVKTDLFNGYIYSYSLISILLGLVYASAHYAFRTAKTYDELTTIKEENHLAMLCWSFYFLFM